MVLTGKKLSIDLIFLTNIVFCFFPISFILGNFFINLNLILFCCLGFIHLRSKIFTEKLNFTLKIIFIFFLYIFFSTLFSLLESIYAEGYELKNFSRLIKSIAFLRFFLFLLVIYLLNKFDILNFKLLFLSSFISSLVIATDVTFQYIFGFNFIGLKSLIHHNTSFFGDELISGGFIQNFSFFSILFLYNFLRNKNYYLKFILMTAGLSILATGIIVSGNKMPLILFIIGLLLIFLFSKKLRKIIIASYLVIFFILGLLMSSDKQIKSNYMSFYWNTKNLVVTLIEKVVVDKSEAELKEEKESLPVHPYSLWLNVDPEHYGYKRIFFTALETWKLHKIIGNGIKSFREDCNRIEKGMCSNHPHNYYLEVMTDLGIVGLIIVLIIALIFIVFLIKNYRNMDKINVENLILLAAIISLSMEVFPFKSSGSIFTTNNAAYIILISGIIISYKKIIKI